MHRRGGEQGFVLLSEHLKLVGLGLVQCRLSCALFLLRGHCRSRRRLGHNGNGNRLLLLTLPLFLDFSFRPRLICVGWRCAVK